MEVNTILDQVLIDLLSTTLLGGLGTLVLAGAVGAAGGLAVGPILANFFTNYADQQFSSGLNSASAGWAKSNVFVVGPVQLSEASPSNGEFLFSATFTFTPTTWEGIFGVVQGALDNIPSS